MSEQKEKAQRMTKEDRADIELRLNRGESVGLIVEATGVAKPSVERIARQLKAGSVEKNAPVKTSATTVFKAELDKIRDRKKEVQDLLNGTLKKELEALELKEISIQELIKLYEQ